MRCTINLRDRSLRPPRLFAQGGFDAAENSARELEGVSVALFFNVEFLKEKLARRKILTAMQIWQKVSKHTLTVEQAFCIS